MNDYNVSSKNETFIIKICMNLYKFMGIIIISLFSVTLCAKSIAYSNCYYGKTQSIEYKSSDDKLKLNLLDKKINISSLSIKKGPISIKKDKICSTINLRNGFKSNVYFKYKWNKIMLYSNIPSLSDSNFSLNGILIEKNNLRLDFSTFENREIDDMNDSRSFYYNHKLIKDLIMGNISIFDYKSSNINVRYELVNSIMGTYYSSYIALGFEKFKVFFEKQNLDYSYHMGLKLERNQAKVCFNDYFYPQSKFSGKGCPRKYEMEATINKIINKKLMLGYTIKSIRVKLYEKIENDEDLNYKRSQWYYLTLYLSKNLKYNIKIRFGIIKEKPLIELSINNLQIGYSYKGFYDSINLKFKRKNTTLNINYIFKKKLNIKLVYLF